jgi:hypothetical protein
LNSLRWEVCIIATSGERPKQFNLYSEPWAGIPRLPSRGANFILSVIVPLRLSNCSAKQFLKQASFRSETRNPTEGVLVKMFFTTESVIGELQVGTRDLP